jgi:hypothetical protein
MKYQLMSAWPVGPWLIPQNTVIDTSVQDQWTPVVQGNVPPPNSVCLDTETYRAMLNAYPLQLHSAIVAGPNVNRNK